MELLGINLPPYKYQFLIDAQKEGHELKVEDNDVIAVGKPIPEELDLVFFRQQRENYCFPIINRGILWYNKLTDQQKEELDIWYQAWLDITETKIIPEKPEWID